jgi:hypothetical protein
MTVYLSRPKIQGGRRVYRITADTRRELEEAQRLYACEIVSTGKVPHFLITDYWRQKNRPRERDYLEDDPARWKKITL